MAITIDLGEANDIHPRNKKEVGYRLSLPARALVYNDTIVYSGPTYKSMISDKNILVLSFDHVQHGLMTRSKYGYVTGFQIAGKDGKYYWTQAEIKGNQVYVYPNKNVEVPVSVRYAWSDNPDDLNLYNGDGLPMGPFRIQF